MKLSRKRIHALLYHHYNLPCSAGELTYPEQTDLLSQIRYVSEFGWIRKYLREIKHVLFSLFTQDYEPDLELDEDETLEDRKETDFKRFQDQCNDAGLIPPEG